jgi:hypothetical protein
MPLRRMTAHWVVLAAAALTTLVAAAVAAALAVFSGQALPRAVTHDLSAASGTALSATGPVGSTAQLTQVTRALKTAIGGALPGIPFGFWQGSWSDPLGLVPGAVPARPANVNAKDTPLLEAAALSDVQAHAVLVSGRWPAAPAGTASAPIQAALPASAAALLHVSAGDRLTLRDRATNATVRFTVTGLFAERQLTGTGASYWLVNPVPASGSNAESGFVTYGPLLVDPAAFRGPLVPAQGTWAAQPDMAAFTDGDLNSLAASVSGLQGTLGNSSVLDSVQLSTGLPGVLTGTAQNLAVARSLLVISALQLLVLTGAALLAVAALLTTQREGETALLSARGATRWQLIRLTALEVIPLCVIAALAGAAAGVGLARLLGGSVYRAAGGGPGIPVRSAGTWLDALAAMAVIAVIAVAAMLLPGARRAPGASRARRGRQAVIAGATRAGADIGLVVLAVLAGWQLRRYSAVSTGSNGLAAGIDPVLALAPALALAGGTVLTLRLLPAAARAADRLAARGRRLTAALAGWQFSRQPLRQGGAALLLVMAVATGTLALAQHASWTRAATDQAAHAAGADVRVDLAQPLSPGATTTITSTKGVRQAMAAAPTSGALPVPVLAIDAARAPGVALLRADQSPLPASSLFRTIAAPPGAGGTRLAGAPAAITLTAALGRAGPAGTVPAGMVPAGTDLASATVTVTVTDATGAAYQLAMGALPDDGRPHRLSASLGGRDVSYPLRLAQLTVNYLMPARRPHPVTLTLSVPGAGLSGWTAVASSPELSSLLSSGGALGPSGQPSAGSLTPAAAGGAVTFGPGYGQAASNPGSPTPGPGVPVSGQLTLTAPHLAAAIVPAIVTRSFATSSGLSTGSELQASVNGVQVPLRIAAVVTSFPTLSGGAVIVDLATIESFLAGQGGTPLPVTQWWLKTDGGQVPPGLTRAPPPGSAVVAADALAASAAGDPLSAAPQQALLAMAAAAALLAVTGFWVSIAANVRQRRGENALLAALGVTRRSAAAQLFLEKLMLSVPSAALGLVLGAVVARLLVPAVTLTTTAQAPVPPPVTLFDPARALALAAVVAVLPALAAALVMIRRPDPAAELRAAEAA